MFSKENIATVVVVLAACITADVLIGKAINWRTARAPQVIS